MYTSVLIIHDASIKWWKCSMQFLIWVKAFGAKIFSVTRKPDGKIDPIQFNKSYIGVITTCLNLIDSRSLVTNYTASFIHSVYCFSCCVSLGAAACPSWLRNRTDRLSIKPAVTPDSHSRCPHGRRVSTPLLYQWLKSTQLYKSWHQKLTRTSLIYSSLNI